MILEFLPWVLSASTTYAAMMAGDKHRHAWSFGILNQAVWLVWIVMSETWGMMPMNVALTAMCIRNHIRWARDLKAIATEAEDATIGRFFTASITRLTHANFWHAEWTGLAFRRETLVPPRQALLDDIVERKALQRFPYCRTDIAE